MQRDETEMAVCDNFQAAEVAVKELRQASFSMRSLPTVGADY